MHCYILGIHMINGDTPDHWSWFGGLVGFVAVIIRVIVILVVVVPYIIMSAMGFTMSGRVISKSHGPLKWFNGFLAAGHGIMLLPAVYFVVMEFLRRH